MKHDSKTFLTKLKLYFSTLFSRSMPKMLMGATGLEQNQALFSNMSLEEVEHYTPDPKNYMHLVTFLDNDFVSDLFEKFPLLHKSIILIYCDAMLSAVNKNEGTLNDLRLRYTGTTVYIDHIRNNTLTSTECGAIISDYHASRYMDIFTESLIDKGVTHIVPIEDKVNCDKQVNIVNLGNISGDGFVRLALLAGQSTVSYKTFMSKMKCDDYAIRAMAEQTGDIVRINFWFACPFVNVISSQPSVIWFKRSNNSNNKDTNL